MQALFFEVTPKQGHAEKYFERAAQLKPELDKHTGLLFLDRYRSLTRADTFLSHQFWQDEASIARWRANCPHYHTQVAGRNMHFEDYRLRVGPVVHEINSAGSDRTFAIDGSYRDDDAPERVVVVIASNHPLLGLALRAQLCFDHTSRGPQRSRRSCHFGARRRWIHHRTNLRSVPRLRHV